MSNPLSRRANQLTTKRAALPKGKPSWVGPGEDVSFGVVINANRAKIYRDRIARVFGMFQQMLEALGKYSKNPQLHAAESMFISLTNKIDDLPMRTAVRLSYNIIMKLNDVRLEIHDNKKLSPTIGDKLDKVIKAACDSLWKASKSIISDPEVQLTWPYGPGLNPTMPAQVRNEWEKKEEKRAPMRDDTWQNREYLRIMNLDSPEASLSDAHQKWKEQNQPNTFEEYEKAFPEYGDNDE